MAVKAVGHARTVWVAKSSLTDGLDRVGSRARFLNYAALLLPRAAWHHHPREKIDIFCFDRYKLVQSVDVEKWGLLKAITYTSALWREMVSLITIRLLLICAHHYLVPASLL